MIISGALKVVTTRMIDDPDTPIHKIEGLPTLFPFWSLEQITHRLYGHTTMTEEDAYRVYNTLIESRYLKYAQLFLQEIYRDSNIHIRSSQTDEEIDIDKLHFHVMKTGGLFGEILKMTANHLEDGVLTIPELEEEIRVYQNILNRVNPTLNLLLTKLSDKRKEL